MITPSYFSDGLFANGPSMVKNLVSAPYTCVWSTMVDVIFSILAADFFTFLLGLTRPSQEGKHWIQYELGVEFSSTLYGPSVLNTSFLDIPPFLLELTCFLTTTRSHVPKYHMSLNLFHTSLCLSLFSYNSMLNRYLCLNRSGDASSKWFKACCPSEVPSLNLVGDRSIGKRKCQPISTNYWAMSVPSTGTAFQINCSSPRWDNLPNGHQRNPLLGLFGNVHILGSKGLF